MVYPIGVRFHLTPGQMFNEFKSSLFKLRDRRTLHKKKTRIFGNRVFGEPIRGSSRPSKKAIVRRSLGIVVHHPSSFDGGDRETISAMESKITYLNAELVQNEREKKREKERRREMRRSAQNGGRNKSDESDQEGDENDKSDKESESDEE
ncbi:hypothetical protein H5410_021811 [Solanum commersonii]|uniref:Uncharacterized protein n=1 Tax=Solanum commersonii TaxID=4109 RepID=A0A9J5ZD13_SOLCO|nr:hypothetical protein H5410_021811 [Solanum commersonii]